MNTQMYSIANELRILRRFLDLEYDGNRRCYSEAEVSAAEARLQYKLPAPIRELYLLASDVLLDMYLLRPLELLHWQQDYLGLFESPEASDIWGICRSDSPNALYSWEESIPEDAEAEICDFRDTFEECDEAGDTEGKHSAAREYAACWDAVNARFPEPPPHLQKRRHEFRYCCSLDAYGLFLVIHTLGAYATELYCLKTLRCYRGGLPDYDPAVFKTLRERIEREFDPLSEHPELLEITPLPMAYRHKTSDALLLYEDGDLALTLLCADGADPTLSEHLHNRLGLPFRPLLPPS